MSDKVYASVPTTPGIEAYWEAANAGKLVMRSCTACGKLHYYPRGICPHCFSDKLDWKETKGTGTIYTYSVMRAAKPSYVIA